MAECPLCNAPLEFDEEELDEGDFLFCEECGASLIVASVDPLEIEEAEEEFDELDEDSQDENDSWIGTRDY